MLQSLSSNPLTDVLLLLIVAVLIGAVLLLTRSRRHLLASQAELQETRDQLEHRVAERTEKLKASNRRLTEALNRSQVVEELLRETQGYLHSMLNSMPSILIGVAEDGRVTHWNKEAERVSGINPAQALGRSLEESFPELPVEPQLIQRAIAETRPVRSEARRLSQGGENRFYDLTIYPLQGSEGRGAVIRADDVTARLRLESMMIHNEKMRSLGELAAGLAHEINNPLSAVVHGAQIIRQRLSGALPRNIAVARQCGVDLPAARRYLQIRGIDRLLENIGEAGERAAGIVRNMLDFSHRNPQPLQPVMVAQLVDQALELLQGSFRLSHPRFKRIELERHYPDDPLPPLTCSVTELQQVIVNLVRNAIQALTDHLETQQEPPRIDIHLWSEPEWLVLEIADNGPGMSAEVQRHLFEPFFTTKQVGQGTGLGLSLSYFIVTEHHKGHIEVSSTPGAGSRFRVRLPWTPATR